MQPCSPALWVCLLRSSALLHHRTTLDLFLPADAPAHTLHSDLSMSGPVRTLFFFWYISFLQLFPFLFFKTTRALTNMSLVHDIEIPLTVEVSQQTFPELSDVYVWRTVCSWSDGQHSWIRERLLSSNHHLVFVKNFFRWTTASETHNSIDITTWNFSKW